MLYLAYGSNLNVDQMSRRCPTAIPYGTAMIKDYELVFRRGFLTIEPSKGAEVPLGVWEVHPVDVRALDRYEGYPRFYDRVETVIPVDNGSYVRQRKCFIYIMREGFGMMLPSPGYVRICEDGYDDFGFDKKYLKNSLKKCEKRLA